MNQETIVHDNKLYSKIDNNLFTTYKELETEVESDITPVFKGALIPRQMWKEILAFMKQSYDKFSSETLVYLFYDETSKTPWSWWIPPQETAGMTVASSPSDPKYQEQRKSYPDTMFGTVHHHCSTSAFQSGTDEADEVNREGIHFTIGHLNDINDLDIHCRITIGGCHAEIEAGTYIQQAGDPFKKTAAIPNKEKAEIRNYLHKKDIITLPSSYKTISFPDMDNVSKKVYNIHSNLSKNHHQQQLGWNYGNNTQHWYEDEPTTFKKNSQGKTCVEMAEDLVTLINTDYEYEDILLHYYDHIDDTSSNYKMYTGRLEDTEIARDLSYVYDSQDFLSSEKGRAVVGLTEKFIREYSKDNGVDRTLADLKYGLEQVQYYDNGEEFQSVDKENVL